MFKWVIQQSKIVLIFSLLMVIIGIYSMRYLSFNHDFEQYFPQESTSYEQYTQHYKTFQDKDNWFFISPETNINGIFDAKYIDSVNSYVDKLRQLPGIEKVDNPLQLKLPIYTYMGWQAISVFNKEVAKDTLKKYLSLSPELFGTVVARDFSSILIKVELKTDFTSDSNQYLYDSLIKVGEQYDFKKIHMGGRFSSEQVYVKFLQTETLLFTGLSAFFIIVVLYFMYGSIQSIVVPFGAVLLSVLWTLMCMTFMGKSLDILTIMLPPILFVITISDLTHLYSRYLEEKQNENNSNREAMYLAISEVGPATFITAFTTATGFISFLSSKIIPIKQFGIYACIGVFISYFIAYFIFPSLLISSKVKESKYKKGLVRSDFWEQYILPRVLKFSIRNFRNIVIITALAIAVSIWGMMQLKVNSFLLDDVPSKSVVKEDMLFLEKNFNGIRPLELSVSFDSGTVWDHRNIQSALRIQTLIEKNYLNVNTQSIVSVVKSINKGLHNNNVEYYNLPLDPDTLKWCLNEIKKVRKRKEVKQLVSEDGKSIRFYATLPDKGSAYYTVANNRFMEDFNRRNINKDELLITGGSQLLDENANSLTSDLILDLAIGVGVISLLMSLLFKKVKMVLIALLPNILPLILTAGFMGVIGIDLKPSNALIFSIAFGIAVDDSIHFLARYKHELTKHKNAKALRITYLSTGKAMIYTGLVVISGFVCLLFSSFQSIYYMGFLVSCTLVFAIFCDMLLLPGLLYHVNHRMKKMKI
jgi:predicted RND superfamily exporter protein